MKNAVMTAALLFAAIGARAEMPQMFGTDPLSRQILMMTAQKNGGVTAAVRIGSGQAIEFKLADAASALLVPATPAPKPASAPKPSKLKTKTPPQRAAQHPKRVSAADKL